MLSLYTLGSTLIVRKRCEKGKLQRRIISSPGSLVSEKPLEAATYPL
jgi:hypothetical protein